MSIMKIGLLLCTLMIGIHSFGQIPYDTGTKQFLNDFVMKDAEKGNLYYTPSLSNYLIDKLLGFLERSQYGSTYRDNYNNTVPFVLTKDEKDTVRNKWLFQKNKTWDNFVLDRAKPFVHKELRENYSKEDVIENRQQFEGKTIIGVSIPAFLRNNTVCLFYYTISYGTVGGGGSELLIFIKENGVWQRKITQMVYVE